MKIKCDYCGSMIEETEKACPNCGAPLSGANRTASSAPRTIEELKAWYTARNLPPEEVTRFFIGKDIHEAKAFGIYKDTSGNFVVYKNKTDGSRAIRYKGADETYAVNELYQKLRAEIEDQKRRNNMRAEGRSVRMPGTFRRRNGLFSLMKPSSRNRIYVIVIAIIILLSIITALLSDGISDGYYRYGGSNYYHQGNTWYYYDDSRSDWYEADDSDSIYYGISSANNDDYRTYSFSGNSYFEDSSWYDDDDDWDWDSDWSWDSDSSWDSGSSYDSGGWDSGSSWDSDW